MSSKDRRRNRKPLRPPLIHDELNDLQLLTLRNLEAFGWELKFVRRPLFQKGIPVVFDGSREKFAVLEEDGSLNENPDFDIRE